jgi:hypothetical protein
VQLYAFDILALDGEDLRGLPLSLRKTNLDRLLARRPDGIFVAPTGRDRSRSVSGRVPDGAGGIGVEAPRPSLSGWPVEALAQGHKPKALGDEPGGGYIRVNQRLMILR